MQLGTHLEHFGYCLEAQTAFTVEEDKFVGPLWGHIQHPNRALWARRYQTMVQMNKQQGQEGKARGSRMQLTGKRYHSRDPEFSNRQGDQIIPMALTGHREYWRRQGHT